MVDRGLARGGVDKTNKAVIELLCVHGEIGSDQYIQPMHESKWQIEGLRKRRLSSA